MVGVLSANRLPRLQRNVIEKYTTEGWWSNDNFPNRSKQIIESYPDRVVHGPLRSATFNELNTEIIKVASGLKRLGIKEQDVVAYQLPNWVTTIVIHHAISRLNAIANPIIPIYRQSEVSYILKDAAADCFIIPHYYENFDYVNMAMSMEDNVHIDSIIVVNPDPDTSLPDRFHSYDQIATDQTKLSVGEFSSNDLHILSYTSGTTSNPKGVLHTYNTVLAEERAAIRLFGLSDKTTMFMPSPVGHVTGAQWGLEAPFLVGANLVLMDKWTPTEAIELIEEFQCNVTIAATPFLRGLVETAPDPWETPLRVFACGGARVPSSLIREATRQFNCKVYRLYGSTELSTITWPPLDTPLEKCAETDGPLAPGVEVKIVDIHTGEQVPVGTPGVIYAHGPELMAGYNDEALNDQYFDGCWFNTGDIGILDEDRYLTIAGRSKDIIVRGGENISVNEVEDWLYDHPAVKEVAVVAMPDDRLQEKACAYVEVKDGHDFKFDDMTEHLEKANIAIQKYPERLERIKSMPRNVSGKIKKSRLREDIANKLEKDPVIRQPKFKDTTSKEE